MRETSLKLSYLLVLVAFATFLYPLTAEARHKHKPKHDKNCYHHPVRPSPVPPTPAPAPTLTPPHGECGAKCSDSNDCDWPCTLCCWQNQTCCFEEPFLEVPPPAPIIQAPTPAPIPMPPHGECGAKCSDSNDCDWPCTLCCWQNQTCCFEDPFLEVPPPASIPIQAPTPTPTPAPAPMAMPPHGECGAKCSDSNDCDWPCTLCCWQNQTCCFEEPFLEVPPPAPIPIIQAPTPAPLPMPPYGECGATCSDSNDCVWPCNTCCWQNQTCCREEPFVDIPPPVHALAPVPIPALAPNEGLTPFIDGQCGSQCNESNDCDWPCPRCCGNKRCCYEEPFDLNFPPFPSPSPSPSPSPPLPILQQPPTPSLDNELAPQPSFYDEYVPYPERVCGYEPCWNSNDCRSWPCTECCADHTCCYKPRNWAPEPTFG